MSGRRAAPIAIVVAALIAATCSSDDDGSSEPTVSAGAVSTDAAATQGAPTTSAGPTATAAPTTSTATTVATTSAPPTTPVPTTGVPPTSAPSASLRAPRGDGFWRPPDPLPAGEPGDVIWRRPLPAATGSAEVVMYRSTDVDGDPIAVTAMVYIPDVHLPPGTSLPVLALAHGTTGIADECAPTRLAAAGQVADLGIAPQLLDEPWIVVATDYEGLGTPGTHTYLVSNAEGRAVLDSVRMAGRLGVGADADSPAVIFGHSQGGGAVAATAELAPSYAPELDVRGAVAGAPATELAGLAKVELQGPLAGFGMMIIAGYAAAYPDLDLDAMLTETGQANLGRVDDGCVGEVLGSIAAEDTSTWTQPVDTPGRRDWAVALQANTPGDVATDVPVYVLHGDADTIVPVGWSEAYQVRACAAGSDVTRVVYPGADHTSVLTATTAIADALAWARARLAGESTPSGCAPTE